MICAASHIFSNGLKVLLTRPVIYGQEIQLFPMLLAKIQEF